MEAHSAYISEGEAMTTPMKYRKKPVEIEAIPTPELSEHEQAEADRFGIHDEDRGVW